MKCKHSLIGAVLAPLGGGRAVEDQGSPNEAGHRKKICHIITEFLFQMSSYSYQKFHLGGGSGGQTSDWGVWLPLELLTAPVQ